MIGSTNAGGSALNYRIKAFPNLESLPETAPENTIAILTETPITSTIISPREPVAPAEGMVWLSTNNPGNVGIEIVRRKGNYMYPSTAKQYVSGNWKTISYKIYQGGWRDSWTFLYYSGDENNALTGGWIPSGSSKDNVDGVMTFTGNGTVATGKSIDLKGYEYINVYASTVTFIDPAVTVTLQVNGQSEIMRRGWNRLKLVNPGKSKVSFYLSSNLPVAPKIVITDFDSRPGIYLE